MYPEMFPMEKKKENYILKKQPTWSILCDSHHRVISYDIHRSKPTTIFGLCNVGTPATSTSSIPAYRVIYQNTTVPSPAQEVDNVISDVWVNIHSGDCLSLDTNRQCSASRSDLQLATYVSQVK